MGKRAIYRGDSFTINETMIGDHQVYLTASVTGKDSNQQKICQQIYRQILEILARDKMEIVHERLFGSIALKDDILAVRNNILSRDHHEQELPFTYIQGQPHWGLGFAGVQLRAVNPVKNGDIIWTIYDGDVPCGRGWRRNGTTYLMLQNIHGLTAVNEGQKDYREQARLMFEKANTLLVNQGASYLNVVRTWIYLKDILQWYTDFNQVRNKIYQQFKLIPSHDNQQLPEGIYLPASTGIMGDNALNAASVMDVLAIIPGSTNNIIIKHETGVRQKSPYRYGSAFSRAVRISEQDITHVMLSGTAAIDEAGHSLFPGDARGQIQKTLEVIEKLVEEEGASLSDICEATVFLKRPEDIDEYYRIVSDWSLTDLPSVIVIADICRSELLFELDAVVALSNRNLKQ
jgi:enamine deaminase RidA (YjgF/YER057c/UK114 family)